METPGTGPADGPDAVTVTSIAATVLTAPLPQPDHVSIFLGRHPNASFQFSEGNSGDARWGRVREWARYYDTTPALIHDGTTYSCKFTFSGIEFHVYAPGDEGE